MWYIIWILALGGLLWEISSVLVKKEKQDLTPLAKAFMLSFFSFLISLATLLLKEGFVFEVNKISIAIVVYLVFGLLGYKYSVIRGIEEWERSIMSFFWLLSLPFLLLSDFVLGYDVSLYQAIGVLFILSILAFVKFNKTKKFDLTWIRRILIAQLIAFFNISSFKRAIENYTNVSTIVTMYTGAGTIIFAILNFIKHKELTCLSSKKNWLIWFFQWASGLVNNLAYYFWWGWVVTTIKRTVSIVWGYLSGKYVFNEKGWKEKLIIVCALIFGVVIMSFS